MNFPIYIFHKIPDEYIAQKQAPEVFFKKTVPKNFTIFIRKHLRVSF